MTAQELLAAKRLIDRARRELLARLPACPIERAIARGVDHGETLYRYGCRCFDCRRAHSAAAARRTGTIGRAQAYDAAGYARALAAIDPDDPHRDWIAARVILDVKARREAREST